MSGEPYSGDPDLDPKVGKAGLIKRIEQLEAELEKIIFEKSASMDENTARIVNEFDSFLTNELPMTIHYGLRKEMGRRLENILRTVLEKQPSV